MVLTRRSSPATRARMACSLRRIWRAASTAPARPSKAPSPDSDGLSHPSTPRVIIPAARTIAPPNDALSGRSSRFCSRR